MGHNGQVTSVQARVVKITPQDAELLVATYAKQRPLRRHYVEFYTSEMAAGHFMPGSPIIVGVLGNDEYLIDGQHRIHGVMQSQTTQQFTKIIYECESEKDLARLYGVQDRNLKRSNSDVLRAHDTAAMLGLSETRASHVAGALKKVYAGFPHGGHALVSAGQLHDMCCAWKVEAQLFYEVIDGGARYLTQKLRRLPLIGIALITFRYKGAEAEDFWYQIAHDDGLRRFDPRKKLIEWMIVSKYHRGDGTKNATVVTQRELALYTARCWDVYIDEREMQQLRIKDKRAPVVIEGTPYDTSLPGCGLEDYQELYGWRFT